jgi:hypothetical protein
MRVVTDYMQAAWLGALIHWPSDGHLVQPWEALLHPPSTPHLIGRGALGASLEAVELVSPESRASRGLVCLLKLGNIATAFVRAS